MPNAIILADNEGSTKYEILDEMSSLGIIKKVLVGGVPVYGRHYLSAQAIRKAHKKINDRS